MFACCATPCLVQRRTRAEYSRDQPGEADPRRARQQRRIVVKNDKSAIEGVSLRLYNPQARQWSLNYATVRGGVLTAPVYGSFDGKGRGQFHGQDMLDGRAIMVRFVISPVSPNEARFEQYYSADGGASWELNWVAVDTRLPN